MGSGGITAHTRRHLQTGLDRQNLDFCSGDGQLPSPFSRERGRGVTELQEGQSFLP